MDEIIKSVAERAGITEGQAKKAVDAVLEQLKDRLPEPVAGQLEGALSGSDAGGAAEALKGIGGKFGL